MLRLPEVIRRSGLTKSTIYERIKAGTFPAPGKEGRSSLWPSTVFNRWMEERGA